MARLNIGQASTGLAMFMAVCFVNWLRKALRLSASMSCSRTCAPIIRRSATARAAFRHRINSLPDSLFRTNAVAIGDIAARKEADGVLRRAKAFETYYLWHPLIKRAAAKEG